MRNASNAMLCAVLLFLLLLCLKCSAPFAFSPLSLSVPLFSHLHGLYIPPVSFFSVLELLTVYSWPLSRSCPPVSVSSFPLSCLLSRLLHLPPVSRFCCLPFCSCPRGFVSKKANHATSVAYCPPSRVLAKGGTDAVALSIAQQYVDAFGKLAKTNNTMLLPSNLSDPASMVAQVRQT